MNWAGAIVVGISCIFFGFAFDKFEEWFKETKFGRRLRLNILKSADRIDSGQPLTLYDKVAMAIALPIILPIAFVCSRSKKFDRWLNKPSDKSLREKIRELEDPHEDDVPGKI